MDTLDTLNTQTPLPAPLPKIDAIISERTANYGSFEQNATLAQSLKRVLRRQPEFAVLPPTHAEALDNIMSKVSRLVCGDCNHADSWDDIQGYCRLISAKITKHRK